MKKLIVLFAIFLAGCANMAQPLSTPSGRPEVTITGSNTSEVKSVISNAMMNRGFSVKNDSESLITYEKTIDDVLTASLFGTRFNTKPASRISFSFASSAGTVRVLGSIAVISNPGSGFEQATDFSQGSKDAENIQAMLEQVKRVIVSTNQASQRMKD
ncbi:hypothetical protein [Herbaspirillum huttiense]|uniref:hypothetical protein n=1 Tax=Herbaspirillum huttiense TaxID=863372 RepID=UPI0039B01549